VVRRSLWLVWKSFVSWKNLGKNAESILLETYLLPDNFAGTIDSLPGIFLKNSMLFPFLFITE